MLRTTTMNNGKWKLLKYARWEEGMWKLTDSEPPKVLALIIQDLQLVVVNGDMVLESLSLTQSNKVIKSIYKNGTLVVALKHENSSIKFRILFSSLSDGRECVSFLKNYMEVAGTEGFQSPEETLPELLATALKNEEDSFPVPDSIPAEYPLQDAIKLCILDPGFPKLVGRIEKIIGDLGIKNN